MSLKWKWSGTSCLLIDGQEVILHIVPDSKYNKMWRILLPGKPVTDMSNIERTKEAGKAVGLQIIKNRKQYLSQTK